MYQKATVPAYTQCLYSLWFAMTLGETGLNEQRTIVCTEVTAVEWNIHTYTIENVLSERIYWILYSSSCMSVKFMCVLNTTSSSTTHDLTFHI